MHQKENKRRQFWFCCHMLSGNCQAGPYLEQWMPASNLFSLYSWAIPISKTKIVVFYSLNVEISCNRMNRMFPKMLSGKNPSTETYPLAKTSTHNIHRFLLLKILTRPLSTLVVSITIRVDCCSHTIYQKSEHVFGNGPWAATYLFSISDR